MAHHRLRPRSGLRARSSSHDGSEADRQFPDSWAANGWNNPGRARGSSTARRPCGHGRTCPEASAASTPPIARLASPKNGTGWRWRRLPRAPCQVPGHPASRRRGRPRRPRRQRRDNEARNDTHPMPPEPGRCDDEQAGMARLHTTAPATLHCRWLPVACTRITVGGGRLP